MQKEGCEYHSSCFPKKSCWCYFCRESECVISPLAVTGNSEREDIQEHSLLLLPTPCHPHSKQSTLQHLHPFQKNSLEYLLKNFRSPLKAQEVIVSCHNFSGFIPLASVHCLARNTFSLQFHDLKYEHIPDFAHFTMEFDTASVITHINIPSSSLEWTL